MTKGRFPALVRAVRARRQHAAPQMQRGGAAAAAPLHSSARRQHDARRPARQPRRHAIYTDHEGARAASRRGERVQLRQLGAEASDERMPGIVHVVTKPRPRSLSESVEVLRQLQRFGEVVMFRNMKYDANAPAPNKALAIFRSTDAAERAVAASPLSFVLGEARHDEALLRDDPELKAVLREEMEEMEAQVELDEGAAEERHVVRGGSSLAAAAAQPEMQKDAAAEFSGEVVPPWLLYQEGESASSAGSADSVSTSFIAPDPSEPQPASPPPTDKAALLEALLTNPSSLRLAAPSPPSPEPAPSADVPWYRNSPGRPAGGLKAVPTFYEAPPREAVAHVNASGMAIRFYNARQPYFSMFAVNSRVYPSESLLGEVPPGLQGVYNTDYAQTEVGPTVRTRHERARARGDRLWGKTLTEVKKDGSAWREMTGWQAKEAEGEVE